MPKRGTSPQMREESLQRRVKNFEKHNKRRRERAKKGKMLGKVTKRKRETTPWYDYKIGIGEW